MNSNQGKSAVRKSLAVVAAALCAALVTACASVSDSASVSDDGSPGPAQWEMPIDRGTGTN